MASRRQSIRTRIILLLAVPFAALLGLWTVASYGSLGDALSLLQANTVQTKLISPSQSVITGLQDERRLSLGYLGALESGSRSQEAALNSSEHGSLDAQRAKTNLARTAFRADITTRSLRANLSSALRAKMDAFASRLGELDTMRQTIDANVVSRNLVLAEYSSLIDDIFGLYNGVQPTNAEIASQARTLTSLGRAREMLSREDALITGVLARGKMTEPERDEFALYRGSQQNLYDDTVPLLSDADQHTYQDIHDSADMVRFRGLEESMMDVAVGVSARGASSFLPVSVASWNDSAHAVVQQLYDFENQVLQTITNRAQDIAVGVLWKLGLTAGVGLLAIVLSVVVAVRVGRKIVREAKTLASAVEIFTRDQLPDLADRVKRGELIEEDGAGVTDLPFTVTEVETLSTAFDAARIAVVEAARNEALARKGVSELFINLARRNQALLHRQLGLLDTMERRVEDPKELDDLFRLDHLATCMRRHAEGLVILAGKKAGRTWRNPVPIVDVARGALAEVEDYTRVQVTPMPRAALAGTAVADTIHLIAELIENAIMFSPPEAPVRVSAQLVSNGLVLEIEDRGLGMNPELLAELNGRLAETPEFDLFDSARLGTFVVSRLAARHDIKVSLRASPYGGTTAIVLLPSDIVVTDPVPGPAVRMPAAREAVPERSVLAIAPTAPTASTAPTAPGALNGASVAPIRPLTSPPGVVQSTETTEDPETAEEIGDNPALRPNLRTSALPDPNDTHMGLPRRRKATTPAPPAEAPPVVAGEQTEEHMGLPVRRRQRSLAPQLRDAAEPASQQQPAAAEPVADPATLRSPEELRSMMSAMQRGWQRGRTTGEQPVTPAEEDSR